jgi:hypothetical protein
MSRANRNRSAPELGHDAFLDIVANLVGILIILVVVLGAQSTATIEEIRQQTRDEQPQPFASEDQLSELAQQSMRAAAAAADANRLEKRIQQYDQLADTRSRQRDLLLDLLAEAKAAWAEEKQKLDARSTELAALQSEFEQSSSNLQQLRGQRAQLENRPEEIVAVAHLPTPMAKTVFGDELHFRLKDNRLSVVPIEKLVEEIRRDFNRIADGSRDGLMDAAVGPIRGYVARYEMAKNRAMVSQGGRIAMATRIMLVGLRVEPLQEPLGDPIDAVLKVNSPLDIELAGRDPATTTITVWVYPDSFAAFRALKEHLYRKGFATAGRPLPHGMPITGSPHGSRSNAQ